MTFIKELFLGPGYLLNLTSPFSLKKKKKMLDFSKTDWTFTGEEDDCANNAKHNMVYIYGKHKLPPTHGYEKCRCDEQGQLNGWVRDTVTKVPK